MHLIRQIVTVGIVLLVSAAPLGTSGEALAAQAPPAPSTPQAGVVGDGSPVSCDEAALHTALAGGGSVTFNCGGPTEIVIFNQQTISQPTTINGGGLITLTAGLGTRLFSVVVGASLQLSRITLDQGATNGQSGGAILNGGTLRLNQVTIQNSQTDNLHAGGAIYTFGPLFVDDSLFENNSSGGGGAIYALTGDAVVEIHNTNFHNNHGRSTSATIGGGAILIGLGASVTLSGGTISENHTEANGGGIFNTGTLAADQVIFYANTATSTLSFRGLGGAIYTTGDLTLSNTWLASNISRSGGGLYISQDGAPPAVRVQNSFVADNRAVVGGGGIYAGTTTTATAVLTVTDSTIAANWANIGGGLSLNNSAANIYRTAIGKNHANWAGGLASTGSGALVRIYDSTIYSNVITTTQGGAILNQSLMDLRNLTLEGNTSGVFNSGIGEVMTMANTVLHNHQLGLNCDGTGAKPTSLGGNFSDDVSCSLGAVSGDVQGLNLDPMLSDMQIAQNTGSQYFAPLPGSPLINTAVSPCSLRDQLGALRLHACDKGAVEFHGLLPMAYLPLIRRAP